MKNHVVILAGGTGSRVGTEIPKQFLVVRDKPVIVHTIMNFQKSDHVDTILVVCIKAWISYLKDLINKYELTKVKWVVEGGRTGYESTRNGMFYLKDKIDSDDYVIIHDAARPILPEKALEEMLDVAYRNGNASLAIPCYETVLYTENQVSGYKELNRNSIMRVQTPQAYRYGNLLSLYERAERENKRDFVYANLLVINYGGTIYFSRGFTNNIKITTKEDIALCDSLMEFSDEELFAER